MQELPVGNFGGEFSYFKHIPDNQFICVVKDRRNFMSVHAEGSSRWIHPTEESHFCVVFFFFYNYYPRFKCWPCRFVVMLCTVITKCECAVKTNMWYTAGCVSNMTQDCEEQWPCQQKKGNSWSLWMDLTVLWFSHLVLTLCYDLVIRLWPLLWFSR